MAITTSSNFQLLLNAALDNYAKQTGIDLASHASAGQFQDCRSADDVIQLFLQSKSAFTEYRDKYRNLINRLRPVVQVVHAISGILSEAATIVPFQPTKAIFIGIDVLISAAMGVSESYNALGELFECVANFLERLHIYIDKIPSSPTTSDIIVKIMVQVLNVLALATKQIKQGRFKKFAKKLLGESEVEAVLQRLDRLTQEEARVTATHTLEVVHRLFDNLKAVINGDGKTSMDGIHQVLLEIQEMADEIHNIKRIQLQKDIRTWLSPPDPSINHNVARRDHHPQTGSWFIQSDRFKEWSTMGSLLWIYGKPGSGKSVLCSSIIQEIERLRDTGLALITYFYCDFRDPMKQSVSGLLASLIAQLSAKSDPCYHILFALYSQFDGGSRRPDDDALLGCLEKMLKTEGQPTIYIIIDAIDESPDDSGVRSSRVRILEAVKKLVDLRLENVRICATSRPEADIQASLTSLTPHTVSLHDEDGQKKDIADYVRFVVRSTREMKKWRNKDRELVITKLSERSEGMFRWITCQLEALRLSHPSAIRRALDDLPDSLDETYDRILKSIPRGRREYAQRLFQCVAVSIRPLRVEELADILAIQFDATVPHYNAEWRPEDPEEGILSACSSLITIVDLNGSRVVRFSHFSVKEYLTSGRLAEAGNDLSQYHILSYSAHTIIAKASLGVLLALDGQVDKDTVKNFPLAIYAARYWVDHARLHHVSSRIKDAMEQLFNHKRCFAAWVWIHDIDHSFREAMFTAHPSLPEAVPLYYATLCGFRDLVEQLIVTRPRDVNAKGGHRSSPLNAAVLKGNVDIARLLLEKGADVAALNGEKFNPLHEASRRGHLDVLKLLLEHRVDVNSQGANGLTPLIMASYEGEPEVARILLRHGAAVDSQDNAGWTPLMFASQNGHLDVVRLLLENRASVDSRDYNGITPLMLASQNGHLKVADLLLENNATVDSDRNDGQTSLMLASQNGHPNVVDLLLQNDATVDIQDNDGRTSLIFASQCGHLGVVHLLLQYGAAMDSHHNDSWTPLMSASQNGHQDIVDWFLRNGATADSHYNGWTSLMLASLDGHPNVARRLLQNGANVDIHDDDGHTPLMLASRNGHLGVVCLLVQSGATVDSRHNNGWTSLVFASHNGHLDVVRFLLKKGANINSRDHNGWSSLMSASHNGHLDVARLLLQNGAAVDSRLDDSKIPSIESNSDQRNLYTPLHLASISGHLTVAELLIQHRADVNSQNQNQETPLHLASYQGHFEIAHLLLTCHSIVNCRDSEGSTPLHRAAQRGHLGLVILLLTWGRVVNIRDRNDKTPLDLARQHGRSDVARFLEDFLEFIDSQDPTDMDLIYTVLGTLISDAVQPSIDHTSNPEHGTSLHHASEVGDIDTARSLLDNGADINGRNAHHQTPILIASWSGRLEVVELLIERGADVSSQDSVGWAPLHAASRCGHLVIVQLLLDRGADVNVEEQDHWTALHLAAMFGDLEIVEVLLRHGANVAVQNDERRTASQVASRYGEWGISRFLSEYHVLGM